MAISVEAAARTLTSVQQLQQTLPPPSSQLLALSPAVRARSHRIRHGLVCGYSSRTFSASEISSSMARPMRTHHADSLKNSSSSKILTSLQSCTPFNGHLQSQRAGQRKNHSNLGVRAGSRRGIDADEGQALAIPFLGKLKIPSFSEVEQNLSQVTPIQAAKWVSIVAVAYAIFSKVTCLTVFNPNFWMYASWLGVVWPLPAAVTLGIWSVFAATRQAKSGTKEGEQIFILGGALVWLVLVPLAHAHGFVDGWPMLLFTLYYFFFNISGFVRDRMYGTLSTIPEDKKWRSSPHQAIQIAFVMAIVGGHWAAAFEAPFLAHTWNLAWQSKLAAAFLGLAVVVNWNSIYFLGKYSDRLVNPKTVVMFGPYRWVRHPMYASYMLLCAGYCLALRSYFSLLFLVISCIAYYDQRTKLEEKNLVEEFGTAYTSYREKTDRKSVV